MKGRHDLRGGYFLNFLYLDHWQPETGNPRGRFDVQWRTTTGAAPAARPSNFYNQYAAFLLGLVGTRQQERAERADDRARVAARAVLPRPVDRERQADARSRAAVGSTTRSCTAPTAAASTGSISPTLEVIVAGRGGNPQNNGMSAGLNNFAPRLGGVYPLQREDGLPHRLRPAPTTRSRGRARCAATTTIR